MSKTPITKIVQPRSAMAQVQGQAHPVSERPTSERAPKADPKTQP